MIASQHMEEIVDRYLRGETLKAVGLRFGVSPERIRQILARHLRVFGCVDIRRGLAEMKKQSKAARK